jgi:hypothetical protein|tara:strand:+ start:53 stop:208 length:156 start_codon:yes stop_codon:yes gene_type:complete
MQRANEETGKNRDNIWRELSLLLRLLTVIVDFSSAGYCEMTWRIFSESVLI